MAWRGGTFHLILRVQIIDRLPLTIETLKTSKLGKIVIKLTKDPPAPGESLIYPISTESHACQAVLVRILARTRLFDPSSVVLYDLPT